MSTSRADRVHRVTASVPATEATGTARLRYVTHMKSVLPSIANALAAKHETAVPALRVAGRVYGRLVAQARRTSSLPGPDGVIDFMNRRSMYSAGSYWRLFADGRDYSGEPGEWWVAERTTLYDDDPFWPLMLLASTSEVTADTDETVRGVACRRYDGYADFLGSQDANSALAAPLHARQQELSKLPVQVWLDDDGRIRQAIYWGEDELQTRIELSDYGVPTPVELPSQHELAEED